MGPWLEDDLLSYDLPVTKEYSFAVMFIMVFAGPFLRRIERDQYNVYDT